MIAEAFKYLCTLANHASDPRRVLDSPHQSTYIVSGEVVKLDKPHDPRRHQAASLDDLISIANRFFSEGHHPVVWYDSEAVVCVIDDPDYRVNLATLALEYSDSFLVVRGLRHEQRWYEQKDFIRLLRISLAGTLDPVMLLEKVRKIRFENGVTTHATVQRDRESLGREIKSRVESDGQLPEEVALLLPVYKTMGERETQPLRCAVEVDPAMGRFQLVPLPDEIERVQQFAIGSIANRLTDGLEACIPSYYGKP